MYQHYIIEGCDRLSKSTLANHIKQTHGFFQVIHYGKPEKLKYYLDSPVLELAEYYYQFDSFENGFQLLSHSAPHLIFDRFTLGEYVYGPRYRNYDGSYVFELEKDYNVNVWDHTALILLTTSDWSFIQDDGESFDFSRKEEEQASFIEAFNKSQFKHKFLIDVNDNGFYKDPAKILTELN